MDQDLLTLHFYRGAAINAYAEMEQSLCRILAALLGNADWQLAAIVFYNIPSGRLRNVIMSELLAKRHGTTYADYWNGIPKTPNKQGLLRIIQQLDDTRNHIVHWHVATKIGEVKGSRIALSRPATVPLIHDESTRSITIAELVDFIKKAEFVQRDLNLFAMFAGGDPGNDPNDPYAWRVDSWRAIFQQPAFYPPLDSHPLSPNYTEPETPPQSSEA